MNKRKKVPAHIIKFNSSFSEMFDLGAYEFRTVISSQQHEDGRTCDVSLQENYHRVTIKIFPVFFTKSRLIQREALLHEFCHTITWGMFSLLTEFNDGNLVTKHQIQEQNERATSRVSHFLDGLLSGQYKSKKKAYREYLQLPKKRLPRKRR